MCCWKAITNCCRSQAPEVPGNTGNTGTDDKKLTSIEFAQDNTDNHEAHHHEAPEEEEGQDARGGMFEEKEIKKCIVKSNHKHAKEYQAMIVNVHDGDTFKVRSPEFPEFEPVISIRILGIDAPEISGKGVTEPEKVLARRAQKFASHILSNASDIVITIVKHDKFGGRFDADVLVDGVQLSKSMLDFGHAKPYPGHGPKPKWV